MAQFVQLWQSRRHVINMLVNAAREADAARENEYRAAVTIQSWFRGCRLRAYLKYLAECATIIQKTYRGHLGRKVYRQLLIVHVARMQSGYYNTMTAKIQSRWRGFYVRKYVFDYHAQRRYMAELQRKNECVRDRLRQSKIRRDIEESARQAALKELRTEEKAWRCHHMLSTECKEGVYKPFRAGKSQPLALERRMKSIKFPLHPSLSHTSCRQPVKHRTVSCDSHMTTRLPPIDIPNKIQGPFCDSRTVWRQRHKPLDPTLRVATPYNSEDIARAELKAREWRERVVEEEFLPFLHPSLTTYQPLLHTTSSYTRVAYGTKRFRDEATSRNIHHREFQTVIPPIPVFDKLNSTY